MAAPNMSQGFNTIQIKWLKVMRTCKNDHFIIGQDRNYVMESTPNYVQVLLSRC